MNQNPPPRGPDNPYYGTEGRDTTPTNPNPTQNQQGHYPTPPQDGHNTWGYPPNPAGHTPGSGYPHPPVAPTPGHGFTPGHGPTPAHYPHYPPPYGATAHDTSPMSTKDWILTLIVMFLPCINIIMMFVWAFSGSGNLNRRNYCRAYLLIMAVLFGLYFAFIFIFGFGVGFFSAF